MRIKRRRTIAGMMLGLAVFLGLVDRYSGRCAHGQQAPSAEAGVRVLLLHNGRVLRGRPTYVADHCVLEMPNGSTVRLPVRQIEADGTSLHDVYEHLRQKVSGSSSIQPRVELVRWCLREGLLEEAANELLTVMSVAPDHPAIDVLYKQIRLQSQQVGLSGEEKPPAAPVAARPTPSPGVADDELELMAQSLPKPAMAMFSAMVQPLLVNRCGGSACHTGNQAGKLRLIHPPRGGSFFRRMTLRNLHTVLQYVQWDDPDSSPLLSVPRKPHGTAKAPILGDEQEELHRTLREWLRRVTQSQPPEVHDRHGIQAARTWLQGLPDDLGPPRPASPFGPAGETVFPPFVPASPTSVGGRATGAEDVPNAAATTNPSSVARPGTPPIETSPPSRVPSGPPADPFDPAVFNRRFHGRP